MNTSSPASSSSAQAKLKRKRKINDAAHLDSDTSNTGSGSDSSSAYENEEGNRVDAPAEQEADAPVLSHAAKRKQKKQKKQLEQQPADNDVDSGVLKKKRKLRDGNAASSSKDAGSSKVMTRQNSVWVGNMSFKTTEENLRAFFQDRGVREPTRVNLPTKTAKGPGLRAENRGFAYVDFENLEAKQAAIALSEQPLLGRKLLIKDGDDFTGRPNVPAMEAMVNVNGVKKSLSKTAQKIVRNQKQPPAPTLFLGNLGFDTTEDSIRDLLEAHRDKAGQKGSSKDQNLNEEEKKEEPWIRKVRLGTFEDSGKCKGFAFVDFRTIDFATSVLINTKNHRLNGRDLIVEYASAEAVRRGAPKSQKQTPHMETSTPTTRTGHKPRPEKDQKDSLPYKARLVNHDRDGISQVANNEDNLRTSSLTNMSRQKEDYQRGKGNRGGGRPRGRPTPGAALALAKRASAAIIPSQGQKITF